MVKVTRISAPSAGVSTRAEPHPLVNIALFSAIGLLLSLCVLLLDQYAPGEWF